MSKVKVSVKKGKGGTLIAKAKVRVAKDSRPAGKPVWQTRAQLHLHVSDDRPRKTKLS